MVDLSDERILSLISGLSERPIKRCMSCDLDCCGEVHATLSDMRRIMPGFRDKKPSDLFHFRGDPLLIMTNLKVMRRRGCEFAEFLPHNEKEFPRCTFLLPNGRCTIYPRAPLVCRLHGFKDTTLSIKVRGCQKLREVDAIEDAEAYISDGGTKKTLKSLFTVHELETVDSHRFVDMCLKDEAFVIGCIGERRWNIETPEHAKKLLDKIFEKYLTRTQA